MVGFRSANRAPNLDRSCRDPPRNSDLRTCPTCRRRAAFAEGVGFASGEECTLDRRRSSYRLRRRRIRKDSNTRSKSPPSRGGSEKASTLTVLQSRACGVFPATFRRNGKCHVPEFSSVGNSAKQRLFRQKRERRRLWRAT